MGDHHCPERQAQLDGPEKGHQRRPEHHLGDDHRQVEQRLGGPPAAERMARQGQGRGRAEEDGEPGRRAGHHQAVAHGAEERRVVQEPAVPVEREARPEGRLPRGVEREDHQDGDRRVEEEVDQRGM